MAWLNSLDCRRVRLCVYGGHGQAQRTGTHQQHVHHKRHPHHHHQQHHHTNAGAGASPIGPPLYREWNIFLLKPLKKQTSLLPPIQQAFVKSISELRRPTQMENNIYNTPLLPRLMMKICVFECVCVCVWKTTKMGFWVNMIGAAWMLRPGRSAG